MTATQPTTMRALFFVGLSQLLLQLVPMLNARHIDPWVLGASAVPIIAGMLVRLAGDDVLAPKFLDKLFLGKLNG